LLFEKGKVKPFTSSVNWFDLKATVLSDVDQFTLKGGDIGL
jgi:hypothetical protein